MFVKIEKNTDGSHTFQCGGNLDDGWAVVPDDMPIPNSFPFVNIETALVTHPAVTETTEDGETAVIKPEVTQIEVISITEGEEIQIDDESYAPSQLDVIEAQVTYTAMMTETILEGNR